MATMIAFDCRSILAGVEEMNAASLSTGSASKGQFGDAALDLPALGAALWRKKWQVIRPTVLAAFIAIGVVQLVPPKFQSESRVLIEERGNIFLRPEADKDLNQRDTVDQEAVTSQVQLMLSRDLAQEVIAKLKLNERREFDPAIGGVSPVRTLLGFLGIIKNPLRMTPQERVLEAYYDRLTVYAVEKSRVIVIDFLDEDPQTAARVANAIADAYLVRQRAAKQEEARTASRWLAGEIDSMQKRVAEAEAKIAAFRGKSNLLVGPNNTTLSEQQLGEVTTQLAAARAQKADAEARAKLIRGMLRSGEPIESSDILNSELIRRLSEQRVTLRAQLAEQSSSLLDGHPRIKELKAQIADLDAQIRTEAETIARSLENDAKLASARVDSLTQSLELVKSQALGTNEQSVQLRALERDAKAQRDLLESYLAKYREAAARETNNSEPADARVISRATVSTVPAYPKKLPTVLIVSLATMMLCCGWVLTRELLATPAAAPPERVPAAPTQGVPQEPQPEPPAASIGEPAVAPTPPSAGIPLSALAEVSESLQRWGGGGSRIAVLAVKYRLDSGTVAIKLARSLAEKARVVLVGLGGNDEAIKAISSNRAAAGLAELAAGRASFAGVITKDRSSGLNLIVSGSRGADRVALLSSPSMSRNFTALARSYEYLVVDAGMAGGAEMQALAEIAPHAMLLTDTPTDVATAAARERLVAAGFDEVTVLVSSREAAAGKAAAA
jgi:polysaccharide biosynthesis transport protein